MVLCLISLYPDRGENLDKGVEFLSQIIGKCSVELEGFLYELLCFAIKFFFFEHRKTTFFPVIPNFGEPKNRRELLKNT